MSGQRPPSSKDVFDARGQERKKLLRRLPVHCKPVTTVRRWVIDALANRGRADRRHWWREASRFVYDRDRYRDYMNFLDKNPSTEHVKTKMDSHFKEQLDRDRFAELTAGQTPLDWIVHFGHPEHLLTPKERQRAIKWTRGLNNFYGKDSLVGVPLPTRQEQRRQAVRDGTRPLFAITLDASAFFDAFELDAEISLLQCVEWRGRVYRSTRMSMGQRSSVDVAQSCALVLADFDTGTVEIQCNVDNFRLTGPDRDELVRVAAEFVRRTVVESNVTLNEIPLEIAEDPLRLEEVLLAQVHQRGDWLGCTYDYEQHSVCVAEKSVAKLRYSYDRAVRDGWTVRSFYVHMGLLFFFMSVLDLSLAPYFDLMRAYSHLANRLDGADDRDPVWEFELSVAPSVTRQLTAWTETALENKALDLRLQARSPRKVLFVDASALGWGAILFDTESGAFQAHHERWRDDERFDVHHSAWAEPEAAYRAIARFVPPGELRPTLVISDSTTAVMAIENRRSPSYFVNTIAARLARAFPPNQLLAQHIPGESHPCDWMSRPGQKQEELVTSEGLRRVMGSCGVYTGSTVHRPAGLPLRRSQPH